MVKKSDPTFFLKANQTFLFPDVTFDEDKSLPDKIIKSLGEVLVKRELKKLSVTSNN